MLGGRKNRLLPLLHSSFYMRWDVARKIWSFFSVLFLSFLFSPHPNQYLSITHMYLRERRELLEKRIRWSGTRERKRVKNSENVRVWVYCTYNYIQRKIKIKNHICIPHFIKGVLVFESADVNTSVWYRYTPIHIMYICVCALWLKRGHWPSSLSHLLYNRPRPIFPALPPLPSFVEYFGPFFRVSLLISAFCCVCSPFTPLTSFILFARSIFVHSLPRKKKKGRKKNTTRLFLLFSFFHTRSPLSKSSSSFSSFFSFLSSCFCFFFWTDHHNSRVKLDNIMPHSEQWSFVFF